MKAKLATVGKFLVTALGNLIADLAQIEALLPTATGAVGAVVALGAKTGTTGGNVQVIAGGATAVLSAVVIAIPKAVKAAKQARTELELLLEHVQPTPATPKTPTPTPAPVPVAQSPRLPLRSPPRRPRRPHRPRRSYPSLYPPSRPWPPHRPSQRRHPTQPRSLRLRRRRPIQPRHLRPSSWPLRLLPLPRRRP